MFPGSPQKKHSIGGFCERPDLLTVLMMRHAYDRIRHIFAG